MSSNRRFRSALALALLGGCERSPPDAQPPPARVLFVTWDTTRADRLGAYGGRARTPCFDALAARGVLYEQAIAVAPVTLTSHASLLTGVGPSAHGVRSNALFELSERATTLPEVLLERGFRTGAFVAAYVLDPKYGLDQGFEVYDAPDSSLAGIQWGFVERPAGAVVDVALRFVETLARDEPFFLWVHCFDPHQPWGEPRDGVDPYDAEIETCDRELARLLERLQALGLADGLITIVTADHGESLGEHGETTHGTFLYQATLRVPLVIAPPPPGVAPGTRVATRVSNVDLAVTLLERLGLPRSSLPEARSLALPARDGAAGESDEPSERVLLAESWSSFYAWGWAPLRAIVWRDFKYVAAPRPELYALAEDPHERRDLSRERADVAARLAARLAAAVAEQAPLGWEGATPVTPDDERRLLQLGYAGMGGATIGEGEGSDLPDPKDRIGDLALHDEVIARVREASALLGLDGSAAPTGADETARRERGRALLLEAKEQLSTLAAANPADKLPMTLGPSIELGLGHWSAAADGYERLVAANPAYAPNHVNLANAYFKMGRVDWAVREMEKAAHLDPGAPFAPRWLLETALSRRDWPAAAWWVDVVLARKDLAAADRPALDAVRKQVQAQLGLVNARPRAPAPVAESDLEAEGTRKAKRDGS